jgi:hypothetical protein
VADRVRSAVKRARGELLRRSSPVRWHDLRRLDPIDRRFGMSRGTPVDRRYIERFLDDNRDLVRGRVLEVADARYTEMFGGGAVTESSVLHAEGRDRRATIVGDLTQGLPGYDGCFDCLILTQVMPFMYDIASATSTIRRLCRDGGVALVTVPGISQISTYDKERWGDYWRFTEMSARRLFAGAFGEENVEVTVYGNVLAAVALLHGIAAEELTEDELSTVDPDYPVLIGVVARAA